MSELAQLIQKYDVPAPRYTSYPTVPHWKTSPTSDAWLEHVRRVLQSPLSSWSMYIHIPFCETLCTFCGCNTSITKNKQVGADYVETVLAEWAQYLEQVPALGERAIKSLHLGGGTPTFLRSVELERLLQPLLSNLRKTADFEASLEVDPRRTTEEQLQRLRHLGFNRISLGVQDLDPLVQHVINRHQTLEQTQSITRAARELGYASINWDLIYGLPKQTATSVQLTIEETLRQRPDRIALYSFALVPWIKPQQRLFTDADLPQGQEKRDLYELARRLLLEGGYLEVGMDHFATSTDALTSAQMQGKLHRNFMGYTDQQTDLLLGLGVSAISETGHCFHQNEKVLAQYVRKVEALQLPTLRGHELTPVEIQTRQQILELMTQWSTRFLNTEQLVHRADLVQEMLKDGLVQVDAVGLQVLEKGRPFLRNICMLFDPNIENEAIIKTDAEEARVFSRSI